MGHHIGSLTASSILDTFSNNDFINVLNYTSTTNYTIPCFENMLVQATRENIGIFRQAIELMQPEGKTDIAQALEVAFNLLKSVSHNILIETVFFIIHITLPLVQRKERLQ